MTTPLERVYSGVALLAIISAVIWTLNIQSPRFFTPNTAAYVNQTPIPQAEYTRALEAMQAGLTRTLTDADRERALNILIDEELLVQKALDLNLAEDDRLVRKNLVQAMITSASAITAKPNPSDADLRAFYAAHTGIFTQPRRITLKLARAETEAETTAFITALQTGISFERAREQTGLEVQNIAPRLPLGKIGDLFGGSVRDAVNTMQRGDIVGPIPHANTFLFIWMTQDEGGLPAFETLKDAVSAEWQRREGERALQAYIAQLRRSARIQIPAQNLTQTTD